MRYYDYIASHPCITCGASPVEVAHLRLMASRKSSELAPRSHHGLAKYCCVLTDASTR